VSDTAMRLFSPIHSSRVVGVRVVPGEEEVVRRGRPEERVLAG